MAFWFDFRDIDTVTYEEVCQETLDSLCEFFDDIIEESPALKKADVSFGVRFFIFIYKF